MLTIEQIRAGLKDRKLRVVSKETGIHYNTIYMVASGKHDNPGYQVIKKLSDYLTNGVQNVITESD